LCYTVIWRLLVEEIVSPFPHNVLLDGLGAIRMPRKDNVPHLRLRLEPALLARLEKSRAKTGRTLTGEIADRLENSFRKQDNEDLIETAMRRVMGAIIEVVNVERERAAEDADLLGVGWAGELSPEQRRNVEKFILDQLRKGKK